MYRILSILGENIFNIMTLFQNCFSLSPTHL